MTSTRGIIAITGATGLLGRALCEAFAASGWHVRALCRNTGTKFTNPNISVYACDLPDTIDAAAFAGAQVVIHAAYSMRSVSRDVDRRVNIDGSRAILKLAREAGVHRYIFVSSVSAHARAQGFYGQSKLQLEKDLDPSRDLIIRPGLILDTNAGLFVRMLKTVKSTGIAPMFGGGHQIIQTVHIADLAAAFVRAVDLDLTGTLVICEPKGMEMRDLFKEMGRLLGRPVRIVSLPFGPVLLVLRCAESLGLRLAVSSDNLLGLRSMEHMDSRPSIERLGVNLRDASQSLSDLLAGSASAPGART
ncbi:MAG: NAD-dependent epimerase/dehydratase family protein [Phycisphaerales bacterium]|jgi:NADH dehydrogenase